MIKINFDKLKREVQDNLLDSFRGEFAPRPILARLGPRRLVEAWVAMAGGAAVLLMVLCLAGFGSVTSALSVHPAWVIPLYALLAATCAIAVLNAVICRAREKALPFVAGVYVFPANVIDARDRTLHVHALTELSSVSAGRGGDVVLAFGPTRFSFPVDRSQTQQAVQAVEAARDRMRAPLSDQELRQLDPLAPPVVAGPFTSGIPIARTAPIWERQRVPMAALVGCAVGAGLFFARNAVSDARMLAWAKARDDVPSYASYLAHGRRHREIVSQELLPRAALRAAVAKGSVEAIDDYSREYPATGIQAEVAAARHAALVAELERARAAGTFAALLGFAERYPEHGLGQAFGEAKHALYVRALERYRTQRVAEPLVEFVGRLVASAERAGPRKTDAGYRGLAVQVRFRRLPSKDIDRADELVRQNPMFNGVFSLPSRYVTPARFEPHERTAAAGLASGLARAFDPEIATFEPGPRLDGEGDLLAPSAPTLVVSYRVEPSGAAYAIKKPRGIFLGLMFSYTAELFLPGDANPMRIKLTSTQRIPAAIIRQGSSASPPGTLEAAVYDAMVSAAFVDLQARHLSRWLKDGGAPR